MNTHLTGGDTDLIRFFTGFSLEFCLVLIVPFLFILCLYGLCWSLSHGLRACQSASPDGRRFALCLAGATASAAVVAAECLLGREMPMPRAALLIGAALFSVSVLARRRA